MLLARHAKRPHSLDYIRLLVPDFQEIHGDRGFADDPAIVAGFGTFEERPVMIVAEQKGRDTKQKLFRNFGMPKPEGYRKALRAMQLAAKFGRPVITLLDTPGAYPGVDAEERGQAEAIARNLREMARLDVPIVAVCIGEGGSGGALALGVGNIVLMLGKRGLQRDFSGELRRHYLPRFREGRTGSRRVAAHRRGPAAPGRDRWHCAGAARRRA